MCRFSGGGLGIAAALVTTRFLASLLYGLTPADPLTFTVALGMLLGAASLASWLPAWRAAKVDPMQAIRNE